MRDSRRRQIAQLALMLIAAVLALTAPAYNGQWLLALVCLVVSIVIRPPWLIDE